MFNTSLETWDLIEVNGVETVFYFGNPLKQNTEKAIYFPVDESYATMGHKMLRAFEWALDNKDFDYIARVNSSCFVDKKELIKHIQGLPDKGVFQGLIVPEGERPSWIWGGGQLILSKDVIEAVVENQVLWNHSLIEDVALSDIVSELGFNFRDGVACSIDQKENHYSYTCYKTESFDSDKIVKAEGQFFYRVKQDRDRNLDEKIMRELYNQIKC